MAQSATARAVIGHTSAWGLTSRPRVQPYQLTAGSTDTMTVRVREKIDIRGVGTDVVDMQGVFTVRRDHPCVAQAGASPQWGQSCLKTEFRSLELYGESPVFGTVRVHLSPEQSSHGEVGPADQGSLAANCVAHCFPTIELPELGMKLTTAGQPIELASKVIQIPPVGDVARSENSAPLVDESGNEVGEIISSDIEVGDVLVSIPLGKTSTSGSPPIHDHSAGSAGDDPPSGPCFYAEDTGITDGSAPDASQGMGGMQGMQMPAAAETDTADATKQQIATNLLKLEEELSGLAKAIRKMIAK